MKNTRFYNLILFIAICLFSSNVNAQEKIASSIDEYNALIKEAKAGDVITLKNGIWKDVKLNAHGNGEKGNPIIVKAETAGQVIISGNSTLNIYGEYVIVSGLWFKDGYSNYKSVVQFRKNSKEFANNCRLTNSTISYYKVADEIKDHWVDIWGKNNRVDHNNFTGKMSPGTTLVVWLKGEEHVENHHRIDNNFFGPRPELGTNGGETIRIGTSANSLKSSKTLVERNVFANCDGEIEIISNKSCDNIYKDNLFIGSKGCLTLRHGNNALVERNVFFGNGVSKTGGIRVINAGHIIRNNLMVGLQGDGYRGSIVVMNGVPNSPLNRYHQVKNVDIKNNTIINSGTISFGEGKDAEKSLAPKNVNFANNVVLNNTANKNVFFVDEASDIKFSTNYIDGNSSERGFTATKLNMDDVKGFPIPTIQNPDLLTASKTINSPESDITKTLRKTFNAGAFNLGVKKIPKALSLRAGPGWKPKIVAPKVKPKEIIVEPGDETLRNAFKKATPGSIIRLKTGEYLFEKSIKVSNNVTIIGDRGGASILTVKKEIEKPLSYFFRLNEGARLNISNVIIDGETSSPKYAFVSPDEKEKGAYSLFVDNVIIKNFNNKNGGSIFKAYNGTKADTLSFKNSRFENSYRGLNLSYDKDVAGFYNANIILLENSVFKDIEENAVNYIRNTPLVELPGGKLVVKNCVFSNVYNKEKGKILRVTGINAVEISNSVFENSYKIKSPIDLKGKFSFIKNSLLHNVGFLKISGGAKKENLLFKNPKWEDSNLFIPNKKSPLLKEKNGKVRIGLKN